MTLLDESKQFKEAGLHRTVRWLEISHLKGVTVERGYNPFYEMVATDQRDAWKGLVRYKYDHHMAREKEYGANFYRLANNVVLRSYLVVTSPYKLKITSPNHETTTTGFQRLLVAENNLYKPAFGAYFEKTEAELLAMYTPRKWLLADIDGAMKGNPILPKFDQLSKTFVY